MNKPVSSSGQGIQLAYFLEKIVNHLGGREGIRDKTTRQICAEIIVNETAEAKCAYIDLIREENPEVVKEANVFVSHAWEYPFLSVVHSLQCHFPPDSALTTYIWFDLVSQNQHTVVTHFDHWAETFQTAIGTYKHTVLILSPWKDPIPLKRAWCLFEIFCTAQTKSKFEIAMNAEERISFLEEIKKGNCQELLDSFLSGIDVANSESTVPSDKTKIFAAIAESVGIDEINSMVLEKIRDWVLLTVEMEMINLKSIAGDVYLHQGKYTEAQSSYQEVQKWRQIHLPGNHPLILQADHQVAQSLFSNGDWKNCELQAKECYEKRKLYLGEDHPDTLKSLLLLGRAYQAQVKYDHEKLPLAESCFVLCLERRKVVLPPDHVDTLHSMHNLALIYHRGSTLQEAKELALSCLEQRTRLLGANHPATLNSSYLLGGIFDDLQEYDRSFEMYSLALTGRQKIYGKFHPLTAKVKEQLGVFYVHQGKLAEAEEMYRDCYEQRKRSLGERHRTTISSLYWLGDVLLKRNQYKAAEENWKQCLELYRSEHGYADSDPHVTRVLEKLNSLRGFVRCEVKP
jgi:tetratricopeptide (TPR) repeat protein